MPLWQYLNVAALKDRVVQLKSILYCSSVGEFNVRIPVEYMLVEKRKDALTLSPFGIPSVLITKYSRTFDFSAWCEVRSKFLWRRFVIHLTNIAVDAGITCECTETETSNQTYMEFSSILYATEFSSLFTLC